MWNCVTTQGILLHSFSAPDESSESRTLVDCLMQRSPNIFVLGPNQQFLKRSRAGLTNNDPPDGGPDTSKYTETGRQPSAWATSSVTWEKTAWHSARHTASCLSGHDCWAENEIVIKGCSRLLPGLFTMRETRQSCYNGSWPLTFSGLRVGHTLDTLGLMPPRSRDQQWTATQGWFTMTQYASTQATRTSEPYELQIKNTRKHVYKKAVRNRLQMAVA